ncbi:uncharacterized protein LOC143222070 [Tachypleus tridentatus]|uniref:uncharacterized protein LOC143222070 n=1 Tax=Tachypleus tridentatus TaxID=6853 RepID=UPI003FD50E1B
MKVLLAVFVVFVSLTLTKGDAIGKAWEQLCEINKSNPEKLNDIKVCNRNVLGGKLKELPQAIRECEEAKFNANSFKEFVNEMCTEEREADLEDLEKCIGEKFAAAQVDPEIAVTEMVNTCF